MINKEKEMKTVVLERDDFRLVQDGSGDSLFDDILESIGIPEMGREAITTIDLCIDSFEVA